MPQTPPKPKPRSPSERGASVRAQRDPLAPTDKIVIEEYGGDAPSTRTVIPYTGRYRSPDPAGQPTVTVPQYLRDIERLFGRRPDPASRKRGDYPAEFSESGKEKGSRPTTGLPLDMVRRLAEPARFEPSPQPAQRVMTEAAAIRRGNRALAGFLAAEILASNDLSERFLAASQAHTSGARGSFAADAVELTSELMARYPEFAEYLPETLDKLLEHEPLIKAVSTKARDPLGQTTSRIHELGSELYAKMVNAPFAYFDMRDETVNARLNQKADPINRAAGLYQIAKIHLGRVRLDSIRDPAKRAEAETYKRDLTKLLDELEPPDITGRPQPGSAMREFSDQQLLIAKAAMGQVHVSDLVDALDLGSVGTAGRLEQARLGRIAIGDMGTAEAEYSGSGSTAMPIYPEQKSGEALQLELMGKRYETDPLRPLSEEELAAGVRRPSGDEPIPAAGALFGARQAELQRVGRGKLQETGKLAWPERPSYTEPDRYQPRELVVPQAEAGEIIGAAIQAGNLRLAGRIWNSLGWMYGLPDVDLIKNDRVDASRMLQSAITDYEFLEALGPRAIESLLQASGAPTDPQSLANAHERVSASGTPLQIIKDAARPAMDQRVLAQAALHVMQNPGEAPEMLRFGRIDSLGAALAHEVIKADDPEALGRAKAALIAVGGPRYADMTVPALGEWGEFQGGMLRGASEVADLIVWHLNGLGLEKPSKAVAAERSHVALKRDPRQIDPELLHALAVESRSFRPGDNSVAAKPPKTVPSGETHKSPAYRLKLEKALERNENGEISDEAMRNWMGEARNRLVIHELQKTRPGASETDLIIAGIDSGMILMPTNSDRYIQSQVARKTLGELYDRLLNNPVSEKKLAAQIDLLRQNGLELPKWLESADLRKQSRAEGEKLDTGTKAIRNYIRERLKAETGAQETP